MKRAVGRLIGGRTDGFCGAATGSEVIVEGMRVAAGIQEWQAADGSGELLHASWNSRTNETCRPRVGKNEVRLRIICQVADAAGTPPETLHFNESALSATDGPSN